MTSTRTGPIPLPESVTNAISSITDTATEVAQNAQQLAREKAARDMVDSIGDSISEAIADPAKAASDIRDRAVEAVNAVCCPAVASTPTFWQGGGPVHAQASNKRGLSVDYTNGVAPYTCGFDNRTNLPYFADRGINEYWCRADSPGAPAGRNALDGAAWVGVTIGKPASVEVKFAGYGGACIANVTVEIDDPSKASVSQTSFATQSAQMTINGLAEGECTIKLICQGKPIGWCHVAVFPPIRGSVRLWRVNLKSITGEDLTSAAPITPAQVKLLRRTLNTAYAQCGVSWNVSVAPVVTYTSPISVAIYDTSMRHGLFPLEQWEVLMDEAQKASGKSSAPTRDVYYLEPVAFEGGKNVEDLPHGGVARGMPSYEAMIYSPIDTIWGQNLIGHELGHNLGLYHPAHEGAVESQLPDNFRLPLATLGGQPFNAMYSDHANMMGYGARVPPDYTLRYHQWNVIRANVNS